ncbi:hypothetical protein Patl1_33927 [Pistacia atlantica]|uniref:Uncharacterized protein n=1 Tax=Pistacia atlantica TaxID=434234 RepID=A0ACC0ZUG1_9ROSI|nr:hypothetical protein Patl1_33927 [Pistacia atlantica]
MTTTCVSFSSILSLLAFYEVPPRASACYLRSAPWISSEMSRPPQNQPPPPPLPHKTPHLKSPRQQQQSLLKPNMPCHPSSPISYFLTPIFHRSSPISYSPMVSQGKTKNDALRSLRFLFF